VRLFGSMSGVREVTGGLGVGLWSHGYRLSVSFFGESVGLRLEMHRSGFMEACGEFFRESSRHVLSMKVSFCGGKLVFTHLKRLLDWAW
jgi:hypothetical protein